jgi:hypothetical protein
MKYPRVAAALVALPMLFAFVGIIICTKTANFINIGITMTLPSIGTININEVISFGNMQVQFSQSSVENGYPQQSNPAVAINSACPSSSGTESCSSNGGLTSPSALETCVPSSAWALIIVNQFFASFALIVQAAILFALFRGKGNRMAHQVLSVIAAIALLISVVSVMNVPARLYQVCIFPSIQKLSSTDPNFAFSVSYTFDVGGKTSKQLRAAISSLL